MDLKKRFFSGKTKIVGILTLILIISTACSLISSPVSTPPPAPKKETKETVKRPVEKVGSKAVQKSDTAKGEVVYSIDFAQNTKDDARKWLSGKGFEFQSDAKSQSKLSVSFSNDSLVLDAKKKLFGLIINGSLHLENAKIIRITWGVDTYPKGASYEKGVNNEPIMVYVYYGDKKLSSGSMFIPNSPYFTGLYLGETDKINTPFKGRHFNEGGRFICLANPKPGETVVSEFDLDKGFKGCFGKDKKVPFISGVALEVETSSTGPSKGFIKKIEFLK